MVFQCKSRPCGDRDGSKYKIYWQLSRVEGMCCQARNGQVIPPNKVGHGDTWHSSSSRGLSRAPARTLVTPARLSRLPPASPRQLQRAPWRSQVIFLICSCFAFSFSTCSSSELQLPPIFRLATRARPVASTAEVGRRLDPPGAGLTSSITFCQTGA